MNSLCKEQLDFATEPTDAGNSTDFSTYNDSDSETASLGAADADALQAFVQSRPHRARALLVRHGETDFNAEGKIQGTLESVLTEAGRSQAQGLGAWLAATED